MVVTIKLFNSFVFINLNGFKPNYFKNYKTFIDRIFIKNEQTQTHPHHYRSAFFKGFIKGTAKVYVGAFRSGRPEFTGCGFGRSA